MRIAVLSDIHGNIHALEEVAKDIKNQSVDKIFCLGDIVNFGAYPKECLDWVKENCDITLKGENDIFVADPEQLILPNPYAIQSADWTYDQLSQKDFDYINSLENFYEEKEFILTHDEPTIPGTYHFLTSERDAKETFTCFDNRFCFYGHTHLQILFVKKPDGKVIYQSGGEYSMEDGEQYLISVGSVGQPRDKDPRAGYLIVDTEAGKITFRRIPYDVDKAVKSILSAGIPEVFANILKMKRD
ncbi:MAG: metallophosphoesterase family protein [Aquificae bacterium]|nr:metallophosphoesterase family protein [Aquificota bacterium]